MTLLADPDELIALCARLRREPYITVDTEFMRDRTYYSKLCVVQVAGENEAVAIDALSPELDLEPLVDLLLDPLIIKVMHACRQDMEIFFKLCGRRLPRPLFDTQIAAMVCGFGEEVGYEKLVSKLTNAKLDKSSRFTDWAKRPLSAKQIRYALDDVVHLRKVYQKLTAKIDREGRTSWVEEELEMLLDPDLYETLPENAWKRLKLRSRDPLFVKLVQVIAQWREERAQAVDVPRNRILRDEFIMELAANRPKTLEEIKKLNRLNIDQKSAAVLSTLIAETMALDPKSWPDLPEPKNHNKSTGPLVELLKVLLKLCSAEHDVAAKLIATSSDLEELALDDQAEIPALKGWRFEMFGKKALDLKHGKLALGAKKNQIELIELEGTAALP